MKLRENIRVELLGDDAIALDHHGSIVHRATGDTAEVLHLVARTNHHGDIPTHLDAAVASLTQAGVLAPSGITRRKMLLATGAGVIGGGLASFALATPAHALSVCPPGTPATNPGPFNASDTFWTGPGVTSVTIQAWGGGGGGSGADGMDGGGGGGGGAYHAATVTVTECTSYSIVVGSGGAGGTGGMGGSNPSSGGLSAFGGTLLVANGGASANGQSGGSGGSAGTTAGGSGANGGMNDGGGGGGSGGAGGPGGDGTGTTGGTAGAGTPPGAAGGNGATSGSGSSGSAPGGGGGGGSDDMGSSGGSGAPGRVIVIVP